MKRVRRQMLKGERVPECQICDASEGSAWNYRDYFNSHFQEAEKEVRRATARDGSLKTSPRSLDYRFSNQCNFKCRMCGDGNSSSWVQESLRTTGFSELSQETWEEISKNTERNLIPEFRELAAKGLLREIYWAGGEPLLWEEHWDFMEQLVRSGQSQKVRVTYNTNLSLLSNKGRMLFDLLPHFKSATLQASMDGVGRCAEFIRTGLNWSQWLAHLQEAQIFAKQLPNIEVLIDFTLTTPGFYGLESFINFIVEHEVKVLVKPCLFDDPSTYMSPLFFPKQLRAQHEQSLLIMIANAQEKLSEHQPFLDPLEDLIRAQRAEPPSHEDPSHEFGDAQLNGMRRHLQISRVRKDGQDGRPKMEDFLASHPDSLLWWNCLKDEVLSQQQGETLAF